MKFKGVYSAVFVGHLEEHGFVLLQALPIH